MRHQIRSAVVAGTAALMLAAGAGTASAQGSLQFALPFPIDIPGLASLAPNATGTAAGGAAASPGADRLDPATERPSANGLPPEIAEKAFAGRTVAAINEARLAVGAERLVADPALEASAADRAARLAVGDDTTGDLTAPEGTETLHRTTLALPQGATPQKALTEMLGDTGMRERMLDGDFARVGVGTAAAADGTVHVVLDFDRK